MCDVQNGKKTRHVYELKMAAFLRAVNYLDTEKDWVGGWGEGGTETLCLFYLIRQSYSHLVGA